jgi:hypothetical protein
MTRAWALKRSGGSRLDSVPWSSPYEGVVSNPDKEVRHDGSRDHHPLRRRRLRFVHLRTVPLRAECIRLRLLALRMHALHLQVVR